MMVVRNVELETYGEGQKTFEIRVFLAYRKAPLILWLNTGHDKGEIINNLLHFVREFIVLSIS